MKGFLQGDSYSAVWLSLTEVPIPKLAEETNRYAMGQRGKERVKQNTAYLLIT